MEHIWVDLVVKSGSEMNVWHLIGNSTGIVLLVLLILVGFSLSSFFIIAYKIYYLRKAHQESEQFLALFWKKRAFDQASRMAKKLTVSPVANLFLTAYEELERIQKDQGRKPEDIDFLKRALRKGISLQNNRLESMVPLLATIGSSAPFIGLFGTVWGIMDAFLNITAKQSVSLMTVAPGIAEALIATAIGLVAAIPAVIAYNYFSNKIRIHLSEMEHFQNDFLNIVKRYIFTEKV